MTDILDYTNEYTTSIGSDKITSSPLVIGDSIYVQTDGGNLFSVKAPNESSQ